MLYKTIAMMADWGHPFPFSTLPFPSTVLQRYRDGVWSLLFHLSLHLEFYTCFTDFWLCRMHHLEYKKFVYIQLSFPSSFLPRFYHCLYIPPFPCSRYAALGDRTSTLCYNARARGRSWRGTLSKNGVVHSRCRIGEERSLEDDAHL